MPTNNSPSFHPATTHINQSLARPSLHNLQDFATAAPATSATHYRHSSAVCSPIHVHAACCALIFNKSLIVHYDCALRRQAPTKSSSPLSH